MMAKVMKLKKVKRQSTVEEHLQQQQEHTKGTEGIIFKGEAARG